MGPAQPEFTSYESPGSTDMVNLTTGDMTYNIPVLDVPGPERSFSLPLTYRAGIRLEQEASWVGLGWSLNPGAIARSLNNYPDDASSESYTSTFKKEVNRGWYGGVPGLLDLAWDSETGHSGTADLIGLASVGWENGQVNSGDLVGVKYKKGEGVSVDPVRMAFAAVTIASLGAAGAAAGATNMGHHAIASTGAKLAAIGGEVGTSVGTSAAIGVAMSAVGRAGGAGGGFNRPTVRLEKKFLHTNYWVFFNDNKQESMYGSLYYQDMSKNVAQPANQEGYIQEPQVYDGTFQNNGRKALLYNYYRDYGSNGNVEREIGGDLHQHVGAGEDNYYATSVRPLSIAHDDFSVMGDGVSGNIRPQRLEVGTLAFPKKMSNEHYKYSLVPFMDDYKVGFRYENSAANGYDYHQYQAAAGDPVIGVSHDTGGEGSLIIRDSRIKSLFGSTSSMEAATAPARKGLINRPSPVVSNARERGLVQGKHVEWYSNTEIEKGFYGSSTDGDGSRFLECAKPTQRTIRSYEIVGYTPADADGYNEAIYDSVVVQDTNNPYRVTLPGKGIGAFRVTAEDGTTYHYSLPVYHYSTYSESREKTWDRPAVSTTRMGEGGKIYATTWLLTAITSSDYVDRNDLGVVDDQDWGGWVKFEYGRFSTNYKWRQPYVGDSYSERGMESGSYSEGAKQTYYLNSIRTRSHTALFVKSTRQDARGHFNRNSSYNYNLHISDATPASSLRLDEIVLLTNEDADKLKTADGIRAAGSGGTAVPALTTNTANNAANQDGISLRNGDTYQNVLDTYDLSADSRIRDYVNQRALKRVVFNYSYRLCLGTPNSFPSVAQLPSMDPANAQLGRSGKLTLESLSTYGPQNTKLIPDFKFNYANNPAYGQEKWDGFGMYNSGGYASSTGHSVSSDHTTASADAAAWSLTEIINPLGSRTQITYERDQYANVSEYGAQKIAFSNINSSSTLTATNFFGDLTTQLQPGDTVTLTGSAAYRMQCNQGSAEYPLLRYRICNVGFSYKRVPVSAVTASTITINAADWPEPNCQPRDGDTDCGPIEARGANLQVLLPKNTEGGDIRVAAVTTLDENNTPYQVRYRYSQPTRPTAANASGVISKLPEFVTRDETLAFYALYDYPSTSVMYGRVRVLRGQFRNNDDLDHEQREEYTFFTPVSGMVRVASTGTNTSDEYLGKHYEGYYGYTNGVLGPVYKNRYLRRSDNRVTVSVGRIGQPIAVEKYNRRGEREMASRFQYTSTLPNPDQIAGQAQFTEGAMTSEMLDRAYYRINRTTKKYVPTLLAATTTVANNLSVVSRSSLYDFLTGQVLETTAKNSLGDTYITKKVPAYTLPVYANMGPKGENSANRNMLSQMAGTYVYKEAPAGMRWLMAASIQTWNQNWTTYRGYVNGEYQDESAAKPVWRQQDSYVWNGSLLNPDGTFAGFTNFNWNQPTAGGQAPGWLKAGEVLRYDHYSKPLEVRDLNGQYAASKTGQGTAKNLASAANARYVEMAYSGAEDQAQPANGTVHFGGEVRDGSRRDATYHHAGMYSSKLDPAGSSGQYGFTYRARVGTTGVRPGRLYRLSAWVHRSDAGVNGGRLYATLNGTQLGEAYISSPTTKKAGDWYLLNVMVTIPAGASGQLVAGCRNAGPNAVYMDDFRFHPLQGPMTAYNYDPHTGLATYVLDNDNLFTHYQYDAAGKVIRVYKESLGRPNDASPAEKLVRENSYNYARMREANWLRTGVTECQTNPDGSPSGYRRYQIRDVNSGSSTYNQVDWESGEYTADCPTCSGERKRWVYGQCETPTQSCQSSSYISSTGMYRNVYRYTYSDGSYYDESLDEYGQCDTF